jgi:ribokinase
MSMDVIGFGSLNYDYLHSVDTLAHGDQQVVIKQSFTSPGGSSANTIYGLAKLGIKTGFLGAVGSDSEGAQILSQMHDIGIDTSKISIIPQTTTSKVYVFIDKDGERAMYSLPGTCNTNQFNKKDIDWLKTGKYIVISAIPGEDKFQQIQDIVTQIHNDTRIVFMPGALYTSLGYSKLQDIIKKTYLLILNRIETRTLIDQEYKTGAKWLVENGCNNVIATLGDKGCLVCNTEKQTIISTPELSPDKIVDSTGAGDAFAAGLVFGLLNELTLQNAVLLGNLAGRFCLQAFGARQGMVDRGTLMAEFEKYSKVMKNG